MLPDAGSKQIGWSFPLNKMENVCHRGHAEYLSNHNDHCLHRYKALTALWLHSITKSFQNLHYFVPKICSTGVSIGSVI